MSESQPEYREAEVWALGRPIGPYQGTFPHGFLDRLHREWGIKEREVLFPFGGATPDRDNWTINDVDESLDVDTHHDARDLPDEWDERFEVVVSDPPYDQHYAETLYDVDHPGYKEPFCEAERVLKPGGWLLILDWLTYPNYRDERLERKHPIGITCGPNTRIRQLNVFRKYGDLDSRGSLDYWD